MKLFVVLCLVAVAVAAPAQQKINYSQDGEAQIVRYEYDNIGTGNFNYAYEQTNGARAEQRGVLKNEGTEDESLVLTGSFSWVGPDGVTYNVNYVADDNGYQPTIEQGPGGAIPSAVVASLLG